MSSSTTALSDSAAANVSAIDSSNSNPTFSETRNESASTNPKSAELSAAAIAKLEKVERMTGEYVQVMMILGNMDVLSVHKVRNEEVDLQFVIAVSGAKQMEMLKVLHGTTTESVNLIVQQGFKVGGVDVPVRHGSLFGQGVYLTHDPKQATTFSTRHGCNYVILCELCVTPDTRLNNHLYGDRKRTTFNRNDVYVQPDKELVRPLYVAEFSIAGPT